MGKVIEAYRNLRTLIAMKNHKEVEKIYEAFEILSEDREWVEWMKREWGDEIIKFEYFSPALVHLGLFYYPKK